MLCIAFGCIRHNLFKKFEICSSLSQLDNKIVFAICKSISSTAPVGRFSIALFKINIGLTACTGTCRVSGNDVMSSLMAVSLTLHVDFLSFVNFFVFHAHRPTDTDFHLQSFRLASASTSSWSACLYCLSVCNTNFVCC